MNPIDIVTGPIFQIAQNDEDDHITRWIFKFENAFTNAQYFPCLPSLFGCNCKPQDYSQGSNMRLYSEV